MPRRAYLRERFGERAPPIIALTAAALVSERDEALNAGMLDFLTKPIQPERLRSVLARWVQRRTATEARATRQARTTDTPGAGSGPPSETTVSRIRWPEIEKRGGILGSASSAYHCASSISPSCFTMSPPVQRAV